MLLSIPEVRTLNSDIAWVAHSWPADKPVPYASPFMSLETLVLWTFTVQSEVMCYQPQLRDFYHIRGIKQTRFPKPRLQWFTSISFTDPTDFAVLMRDALGTTAHSFWLVNSSVSLHQFFLTWPYLKDLLWLLTHCLDFVVVCKYIYRGEFLLLSGRILFDKGWRQLPVRNHKDTCCLSN